MLGADGGGLDLALAVALPWFLVLSAAFSLGLVEAVTAETTAHLTRTRLEHLDQSLAQQVLPRLDLARMRIETDRTRAFLDDTLAALEPGRADAMLRVLEVKAVAAEAAIAVTDLAMKVCGGAAFRKELGIERRFRDARAARVMAPTTDALLDFVGRAICGLPLLDPPPAHDATLLMGAVAYDPKVVTIWDGFRAWFRDQGLDFDYVLYSNYERQVEDLVAGRIHAAWNSPLAWVRTARLRARGPGARHARHRPRPHVGGGRAGRLRHRVGRRPRRADGGGRRGRLAPGHPAPPVAPAGGRGGRT